MKIILNVSQLMKLSLCPSNEIQFDTRQVGKSEKLMMLSFGKFEEQREPFIH